MPAKNNQSRPTGREQLQVGRQADTAEKQQQQRWLDAGIKRKLEAAPVGNEKCDNGKKQTTHNRVWNTVA